MRCSRCSIMKLPFHKWHHRLEEIAFNIILILLIAVGAKLEVSADIAAGVMIAAFINITLVALVLGVVDDARDVSVAWGATAGANASDPSSRHIQQLELEDSSLLFLAMWQALICSILSLNMVGCRWYGRRWWSWSLAAVVQDALSWSYVLDLPQDQDPQWFSCSVCMYGWFK